MSIIVTIEDHGVGVAEEMRETLFQPFRQAQRMTGGTGLGLYSLFKRVEALGGDCGVKARSDGTPGSAFWFSFPYRPDPTAVVPSLTNREPSRMDLFTSGRDSLPVDAPLSGRGGTTSPSGFDTVPTTSTPTDLLHARDIVVASCHGLERSPSLKSNAIVPESVQSNPPSSAVSQKPQPNDGELRVLLTDDAPSILKVCNRMLRSNGHAVQTAVNGHQSLEKLKIYYANNECDVLLTDLQMPVMDGIECTKRFRAWEETQQCLLDAQGLPRRDRFLIVGMSANSDAQSKQEALDAGK